MPKSKDFTHTRALFDLFRNVTLSSAEASLCRWDAGESEHESAKGTMGGKKREGRLPAFPSCYRPLRALLFFDYSYFYWYNQREPRRRREEM